MITFLLLSYVACACLFFLLTFSFYHDLLKKEERKFSEPAFFFAHVLVSCVWPLAIHILVSDCFKSLK